MKKIISTAALVSLFGCASHGVMVDQNQLSGFKRGETTEQEVIAKLGRPTTTSNHNGNRVLIYSGAYAQARPASFIPIVGPLVGGTDVRASSVVLRFDSTGKLSDITSSQHESGGGTGFAAGAPISQVEQQPRKPD